MTISNDVIVIHRQSSCTVLCASGDQEARDKLWQLVWSHLFYKHTQLKHQTYTEASYRQAWGEEGTLSWCYNSLLEWVNTEYCIGLRWSTMDIHNNAHLKMVTQGTIKWQAELFLKYDPVACNHVVLSVWHRPALNSHTTNPFTTPPTCLQK